MRLLFSSHKTHQPSYPLFIDHSEQDDMYDPYGEDDNELGH